MFSINGWQQLRAINYSPGEVLSNETGLDQLTMVSEMGLNPLSGAVSSSNLSVQVLA